MTRPRIVPSILAWAVLSGVTATGAPVQVELYTMGPGDDLFSKFGHAALCVVESRRPGEGTCYNYGTADFSRPVELGWDVVRGRAIFWVSVSDLSEMIFSFEAQDRSIYRQVLPLSPERAASLARTLAIDSRPENRAYVYNHFLDNCSTRPRDLIDAASGGALGSLDAETGKTFREYANQGLASFDWKLVPVSDLLMGRWVDREVGAFEAMFLPRVLRSAVTKRFGVEPELIYERRAPLARAEVSRARYGLWAVVLALVVLFNILLARGSGRTARGARALAAGILGILGTFLLAAALISPLPELRRNELLLVFVPLDFLLFLRATGSRLLYVWLRLGELLLVAVLALIGIFVQPLGPFWTLAAGMLAGIALKAPTAPRKA